MAQFDIDDACEAEARRIMQSMFKRRYPVTGDVELLATALRNFSIKVAVNLSNKRLHHMKTRTTEQREMEI